MTHEQHAKKFLSRLYLRVYGCYGPVEEKEVEDFIRHLKLAIKKETAPSVSCRCPCAPRC